VELDLGGIGKGIAVDAALETLEQAGSRTALVNLGGSIGVLGPPPGEPRGWPIGLAHPRRPGAVVHRFRLASGHVATSGDSERRRETPEGVVHHLLDPRSGEPVRGPVSVTVWRPTGIAADIASTERFLGVAAGRVSPEPAVVMRMRGPAVEIEATGRGAGPLAGES
jgi:thiamine biosynthesis lipoprotein